MAYRDQTKLQIYSNNIFRTGVFGTLLLVFWTVFSVASMQTAIMKRITDSDFAGYSYYSIVSTVTQVSEKTGEIRQIKEAIKDLEAQRDDVITTDASIDQASRQVYAAQSEAFRELLIGAGARATPSPVRLTRRVDQAEVNSAVIDFVLKKREVDALNEGARANPDAPQASPPSPAPSPTPAPASPPPILSSLQAVRACEPALRVRTLYAVRGAEIPTEAIQRTVAGCIQSNMVEGLSEETQSTLAQALNQLEQALSQSENAEASLDRIRKAIDREKTALKTIEAEIEETATLPTAAASGNALTPLEIYGLFPEIGQYIKLGFGLGDNLLMLQHELVLGLLTAIAGAVGGLSKFLLRRYTRGPDNSVLGEPEDQLPHRFIPTTLAGSFAGLSVFLILFGGLAVFQIGNTEVGATANYSSFAAFGFLAGMFAERVNTWLEKLAGRMFASPEDRLNADAKEQLETLEKALVDQDQDAIEAFLQKREEEKKKAQEEAARKASAGED